MALDTGRNVTRIHAEPLSGKDWDTAGSIVYLEYRRKLALDTERNLPGIEAET
jgi:hypothetical protein